MAKTHRGPYTTKWSEEHRCAVIHAANGDAIAFVPDLADAALLAASWEMLNVLRRVIAREILDKYRQDLAEGRLVASSRSIAGTPLEWLMRIDGSWSQAGSTLAQSLRPSGSCIRG